MLIVRAVLAFALCACVGRSGPPASERSEAVADTALTVVAPEGDTGTSGTGGKRLSRLADSISAYLVFAPVGERWFTVASRNRRVYVDIGRVDTEVRRDSARATAYREAVTRRSPVPLGTRFRVRAAWGAEDAVATAVETWNGRIVLRLTGSATMDSAARGQVALVASAYRTDSLAASVRDSCERALALPPDLEGRVGLVRDSLAAELRAGPQPPYDRLRQKLAVATSQVTGCFAAGRVVLAVSLRAAGLEWVRERVVLVDSAGRAIPLRVADLRFRAHDLLSAFDADGDGVDDVAARGTTERAGATTILALDLKGRRLARLAAGFAWEE